MHVTIYHNPRCSNSRRCLEIIREEGFEPTIIEYLRFPLNRMELEKLVCQIGIPVRSLVRAKERLYSDLKLAEAGEAELLNAIATNPILLNRPIVVTDKGAKLCRPPEVVRELL